MLVIAACGSDAEPDASEPDASDPVATEPTAPEATVPEATADDRPADTSSPAPAWIDEEVAFRFDGDELFGVLTLPTDRADVPAVVLVSGSADVEGVRADSSARIFADHARHMAREGFAVLRYDPPGVGRSEGTPGLPSLERRVDETMAALRFVAARPEVDGEAVGLQGWSQGPWVMAMAAARHPDEVAFLVSVVGSGQTVAEQHVYGFEAQSREAGLSEDDVAKAVLCGRLLIDWQLIDPVYRDVNEAALADAGDGPWVDIADLVYDSVDVDPVEGLTLMTAILKEIAAEPWSVALHLEDLYIPRFESILENVTADQLAALRAVVDADLRTDPADFLTEVRVPVLAIFGEHDVNVDSARSAPLFEEYLAGNDDVTVVVLTDVGHDIGLSTPGYWDLLADWLGSRWGREI